MFFFSRKVPRDFFGVSKRFNCDFQSIKHLKATRGEHSGATLTRYTKPFLELNLESLQLIILNLFQDLGFCISIGVLREMRSLNLTDLELRHLRVTKKRFLINTFRNNRMGNGSGWQETKRGTVAK